jgi:hypothetical protein
MKKLLVLSVLLGLMALPMFASDITFGGDATFGFIGDFGDNENEVRDLTIDVKAAIDDYNSLVIEFNSLEKVEPLTGKPDLQYEKALVTTDIGAWLGLPVGLKVSWGWDDPDMNEFQIISAYENEDPWNFSPSEYWGIDFLMSYNIIEVELAFNPGVAATDPGQLLAGLAVKEPIPGLNAEVYYYQGSDAATTVPTDEFGEGYIGFDAAYAGEFSGFGLEAGAYFGYYLGDAVGVPAWAMGAGLSGAYSMFTMTVGLDGNETDALNGLTATAVVAPIDMLDIYAGMYYDGANSELAEIDLGVNAHVGAVEVYVGYLVDGDSPAIASGDHFHAPPGLGTESGAYIKFDVNY